MSTAEQTALKAVVQLNKDSLEKVLTLSWLIIAAKLEDNFVTFVQKRRGGLQVNGRYKEISLSSVILLHKHHPSLGNIKSQDSHPAYATIGCIRLKKFHEFIDKGANILLRTLYSMAHPQSKWIEVVLYMEFWTAAKQLPKIPYMLDDPTHDLHFTIHTLIQTKCGDLNFVEVLKVMKTPKGFECRNRPGRTANYRRRRDQQWYMVHEVNSWDESRLKDTPIEWLPVIHTNNTNKPNQIKKIEISSFHWYPDWTTGMTWFRIKFTPIGYNYV